MIDKIKSKKFSIIYFLSFFIYTAIILFNWIYYLGDYTCVALAILTGIYELVYIVFLRRKEAVSLGRSIARFFLYALASLSLLFITFLADNFINGYQETAWITGEAIGERYYGWEAVVNDEWGFAFFKIVFIPFIIYTIVYFSVSAYLKKKK
ncbi:MAG: hypothetical protein IJ416_00670 [Ruminiclostridium sp.]|nr:hypothetical protein [Ruminiclostridium sp.]